MKGWIVKILLGLVLTVTLIMMIPGSAMAVEPPATDPAAAKTTAPSNDKEYMDMMEELGKALILVSEFLQRIIWPVLLLIGGLLKNDILFAAGMEETMLAIWRNIRNIVNILFILVLLGIAFYNVVGGSSQDYHIKTILPKFVIALIAVNFSFLAVKVVVDGVSVVTTAIFALPNAVFDEMSGTGKNNPKELTNDEQFKKGICELNYGYGDKYAPPAENGYCIADKTKKDFTQKGKDFFRMYDSNNAAIVLAVNMGKVAEINKVTIKDFTQAVKSMLLNVLFSTMMYIVYSVAFVAMLIILAIRLVVLWVTMVLSPLIVLKYVIPESLKSSLGGADELGKKFVQNAIAPIPIALVMSIGFIMLQSWKQARFGSLDIQTLDVNLLTSGMSTLQDLMAAVAMVVIVWVGVFEAAKGTYAESIVGGLKTAVEGAGKFVATAPFKYMPIIPVGAGGDKVSVGTVAGAFSQLPQVLDSRERQKQSDFLENTLGIKSDDSMNRRIKDQKDGDGLGAVLVNDGPRFGKAQWNALGDKLRSDAKSERELLQRLGNFTHNGKNAKQILDDIKAGKTIPADTANAMAAHLRGNTAIANRAGQLASEAAATPPTAPGTAPAGAAATPPVAPAAGAATAATPPAGTPPAPGSQPALAPDPESQADKAFAGTKDAEDISKGDPQAVQRRNKVRDELAQLKDKSEAIMQPEDVQRTVEAFKTDLDKALEQSIPDQTARAAKVEEIMRPYVDNMKRPAAPATTSGTATAGEQPAPDATVEPPAP